MAYTIPQEEIEEAVEKTTLDLEVEEILAEAAMNGLFPNSLPQPNYTQLKHLSGELRTEELFLDRGDILYLATNFAEARRLERFRDAVMANLELFQYSQFYSNPN